MSYDDEAVRAAAEAGVDLVGGEHHPIMAEAARRAGLELLRWPDWTEAMRQQLLAKLQEILEETEQRQLESERLIFAMTWHGVDTIQELPVPVLCDIFRCTEQELPSILDAPTRLRWFDGFYGDRLDT